jgi:hypothetical protein
MKLQKYEIVDTAYYCQEEPDGSTVMKVLYYVKIKDGERIRKYSEYLNFEDKKLRKAAAQWWKVRSPDPVPATNQHAVDIANYHGVDIGKEIEIEYTGTSYTVNITTIKEKALRLDETW